MPRRHAELELFFWTIRLTVLLVLPLHVSDVGIYMGDLHRFLDIGQWPYRDFAFEYPPLTFLLLLIPSFLLKTLHAISEWNYRLFLALLILPFDYALFRGFLRRPSIPRAAFLYVSLTALLSQLIFERLDMLVAFAIVFPFLNETAGKERGGKFALGWGIGSALKLVPLLLLPFRLLEKHAGVASRARLIVLSVIPLLVSTLLVLVVSNGHLSFLSHHSERGVQVESLLGNLFLTLQAFGLWAGVNVETAYRSQQVAGIAGLITAAKFLFWTMLAVSYGTLTFAVWRKGFSALRASFLFLLTFITFGYVLSPQFLFWIIPLGIVAARELKARDRSHFLFGLFLVLLMTGLHFSDYWNYAALHRLNLLFLMGRNAVLLIFWVRCWIWFRARPGGLKSEAEPR